MILLMMWQLRRLRHFHRAELAPNNVEKQPEYCQVQFQLASLVTELALNLIISSPARWLGGPPIHPAGKVEVHL